MEERENSAESSVGEEHRGVHIARERLQIGAVALGVAFIFLASTILQSVLHLLILWNAPTLVSAQWYRWVIGSLPMYLFAMPLSLLVFRLGRAHPPASRERLSVPVLLGLLSICFGLTFGGQVLGDLINSVIGAITGRTPENELENMTLNAPLWANLLFVGILAPVMEELFYRKLVIDRLRRYGDLFAVISSGILFGLIHGNFHQFFYAATIGCLFGYIYVRTGRIGYTVLLHMCVNLVGGVYTTEMLKRLDTELLAKDPLAAITSSPVGGVMYLAFSVFSALMLLVAAVSAVFLALRWFRPTVGEKLRLTGEEWARVTLFNPGIWLLFSVVALLFANGLA